LFVFVGILPEIAGGVEGQGVELRQIFRREERSILAARYLKPVFRAEVGEKLLGEGGLVG